ASSISANGILCVSIDLAAAAFADCQNGDYRSLFCFASDRGKRRMTYGKSGWLAPWRTVIIAAARWLARAVLHASPLALLSLAAAAGCAFIWREAWQDKRFCIAGDILSLSQAAGLRPEAVREIERFGSLAAGRSTLDPCLLLDLREQYQSSPWVRRIISLRRVFPDRLELDIVLRTPAAQVRSGGGEGYFWLVDEEGVLLPVPGARNPYEALPQIVGAPPEIMGRQPAEGRVWSDPAVSDSLDLLKRWRTAVPDLTPQRIVVRRGVFLDSCRRRRLDRPRFEIETREGLTILWGTYNRGDLPDEMSAQEKFAHLQRLRQREVAASSGLCLDVRTRVPGYSLSANNR
ncbi:MAG: hypothetical protein N3A66_11520, partial [Planctomycetota bacterium]|nr:hypothetical protein [Planctomycetota bacterium]